MPIPAAAATTGTVTSAPAVMTGTPAPAATAASSAANAPAGVPTQMPARRAKPDATNTAKTAPPEIGPLAIAHQETGLPVRAQAAATVTGLAAAMLTESPLAGIRGRIARAPTDLGLTSRKRTAPVLTSHGRINRGQTSPGQTDRARINHGPTGPALTGTRQAAPAQIAPTVTDHTMTVPTATDRIVTDLTVTGLTVTAPGRTGRSLASALNTMENTTNLRAQSQASGRIWTGQQMQALSHQAMRAARPLPEAPAEAQ